MGTDISRSEVNDLIVKTQAELSQLIETTKLKLTDLRNYILHIRSGGCEACVPLFTEASGSITAELNEEAIDIRTPGKSVTISVAPDSEPVMDDFTIHQIGTVRYLPGVIAILEEKFLVTVKDILSQQPDFDSQLPTT